MKRAIGGLVIAFVVVGCRPIDGGVVVRTASPAPTPSATAAAPSATRATADFVLQEYPVTSGQGPHDVAPARDGGVWYTAQLSGELGWLDPKFGVTKAVKLGARSAPHGVIVGPDGAPTRTAAPYGSPARTGSSVASTRRAAR